MGRFRDLEDFLEDDSDEGDFLAVWIVWAGRWVDSSGVAEASVESVAGWGSDSVYITEWIVWARGWGNSGWISLLSEGQGEHGQNLGIKVGNVEF
jgi:hypothetical protein